MPKRKTLLDEYINTDELLIAERLVEIAEDGGNLTRETVEHFARVSADKVLGQVTANNHDHAVVLAESASYVLYLIYQTLVDKDYPPSEVERFIVASARVVMASIAKGIYQMTTDLILAPPAVQRNEELVRPRITRNIQKTSEDVLHAVTTMNNDASC